MFVMPHELYRLEHIQVLEAAVVLTVLTEKVVALVAE
jgi:hypothetical protein